MYMRGCTCMCVCVCGVCVRYFNTIFIQVASERNLYDPGDDSVSFAFYLLLQLLLLPSWCVVFSSLFSFYFYSKHVLCAEVEREEKVVGILVGILRIIAALALNLCTRKCAQCLLLLLFLYVRMRDNRISIRKYPLRDLYT